MDMKELNEILEGANIATIKLHKLSDAFYLTGNEVASEALINIANLIANIPEDISDLHHKSTMKILDDGNAQLGNMLNKIMERDNGKL